MQMQNQLLRNCVISLNEDKLATRTIHKVEGQKRMLPTKQQRNPQIIFNNRKVIEVDRDL